MTLGEQIKKAREEKNLSQEALAEQIGVTRQALSKWENNLSVPHGINRELLGEVLELELEKEEAGQHTDSPVNRSMMWSGWIVAAILLIIVIAIIFGTQRNGDREKKNMESDQSESVPVTNTAVMPDEKSEEDNTQQNTSEPEIKSIRFYDENLEQVFDEALWYNTAGIDLIVIDWDKGSPNLVQMFFCPSGTETAEMTEILFTKAVYDGDSVVLLSAEPLKNEDRMGHLYFQLDYGYTIVKSDEYNVFYDPEWLENGSEN